MIVKPDDCCVRDGARLFFAEDFKGLLAEDAVAGEPAGGYGEEPR